MAHVHSTIATHQVRLLIDTGSELTFVSEELVKLLNIHRQLSSISIVGIGGSGSSQTRGSVTLTLCSSQSKDVVTIQAHVLKKLTSTIPSFEMTRQSWPHIDRLRLADPDFCTPRAIDIIIGADSYGHIIRPGIVKHSPSMPIAQYSIFGWLVLGPVNASHAVPRSCRHAVIQSDDSSLLQLLTKFWVQEEPPTTEASLLTPEEQECENHFQNTHRRDSTGRYIVRIPLTTSLSVLGSSYYTAHQSLQRTLKRFTRDSGYHQLYTNFMAEYEQLGHMVKAPSTTTITHSYFLPHHGVMKSDSTTTKLRVVFNGSSPTTTGLSINDIMHTGANLLSNISDVLIWIRIHRHIFATDITKMYRQINLHKDDWDLQRILWVDENNKEVPYQLTTVTYGTRAAPFLAVRTLMQLAKDEGHRFPLALPSLTHGRYVDDIFGGADSIPQLIAIAHQLKGLCNAGGFPLAKWHSTHPEVIKAISPNETSDSVISLDNCSTYILGLQWTPQDDRFSFSTKMVSINSALTKRLILSEVAQIFDPLGFVSPIIIRAKMLLQELWLHKLSWDEILPSAISSRWLIIREDLKNLAKLSIPRWYNTSMESTVELHGFCDASQIAMAAVVYIRVHSPSTGIMTSLVCSKTKVAPLKRLTIPRLELTAALLLARLIKYIQDTLTLSIKSTHLWTDSQVTLTWIKSHSSRWKDYVRNRVAQIQELTTTSHWRYIPSSSNPADCASRGLTTAQLQGHSLWWTGPPWLKQPSDSWPSQITVFDESSALEARPGISLHVAIHKPEYHWDLIYRYSSLNKLLRLTSLCFLVISRLRRESDSSSAAIISPADLEKANLFWVKATQAAFFSQEITSLNSSSTLPRSHAFSRLTAFIDDQGVVRVGGRLDNTRLTHEGKHPAILPRNSRLSALIIDDAHKRTLHGGTQLTLSYIRQTYWILGGRAPVKSHILRCVVCARQRGIRAHQLMGQLPLARVTPSRTFSHTGLDYAGPLTLKLWKGRGNKTQKGWICVFVCLATSAVHLEVVSDYSTEGFIATYRRFSSRRGIPHTLYSDCGTNLIGADAALKKLFNQSTREHQLIASMLSSDRTRWSFNPPASPHMGGKWEAVVKSIKFHLRRTVGDTLLTFEEITTLLTQIEAVLNSRPLEPLSDDPDDISALTPGHFLIGSALTTIPEPSLKDLAIARLSRWQLIQQKVQNFWSLWSAHYLQRQQSISKWHHPNNDIKVGSLVLITDERFPPCKWPLARVLSLHPGKDQLTRVVTVKTSTTTLIRPITKLAILPIST